MPQSVASGSAVSRLSQHQINDILRRIGLTDDLQRVEAEMLDRIQSNNQLLRDAGAYTVSAGGKRLRAILVLLSARLGNYDFERAKHPAVAIELLHAASLVHDDLVDHANARRGRATVHVTWDRDVALALGSYLFGVAARELAYEPDERIIGFYVHASRCMVEGELNPVSLVTPREAAEAQYYRKIGYKTAVLFEAACRAGIAVSGGSPQAVAALGAFGYELGLAFQIVDDILDMTESESVLGKPAGNDLREGTITLPLILAYERNPQSLFMRVTEGNVPAELVPDMIAAITAVGGIEAAYVAANERITRGLAYLTPYADERTLDAFQTIARHVVQRRQ
jgi:heptaprenyl diphosphate synthase/octaprenyl-diphosphate synthase